MSGEIGNFSRGQDKISLYIYWIWV